MSLSEQTRLTLLRLAYDILILRPGAILTTEKVVEEAEKLERFAENKPAKKQDKAVFLSETKE